MGQVVADDRTAEEKLADELAAELEAEFADQVQEGAASPESQSSPTQPAAPESRLGPPAAKTPEPKPV